ncbi:vitamin B12-dependent ribonucleotide reductase [Tepidibacter aestuarii]|uniref:vitamin B12-dependent ribonucleotide reductase n=1 Tax=Tepidibacter aestuarii TaxID=2925782 RepID=UPI0020BFE383|nr:vitamin B12-dependent ribonucleotide reductase [Tepidibacter aestuarii]CAH2214193.1 Vitamin B12-dependent ribonucleotide reductase [Tepidibacter aestuarii]
MNIKNLIKRYYTKELEKNKNLTVYDLFNWKTVEVKMFDYKNNNILFQEEDLEFPVFYSQNACDIIASKYFRKTGVTNKYGYEKSLKEVVHRMVNFWTESALDEGLIDEKNKNIFYDEVSYMLINQMFAPNSPQWFNTGLKLTYGIDKEAEGHFYYDIKKEKVVKSTDAYTRTQGSACFILNIKDTLLGDKSITDQIVTETRLFKHGSGTGTNFSSIRAKGELLSGGGTSSGIMSFLKVFDANAGAIKSGGTTRRAAKMVIMDGDHPEILDFIKWKAKEEDKVVALGKMGYDTDFNSEAYSTVSGQNSNNSIRITNKLMNKMIGKDKNYSWELKGRVDSKVNKVISAKDLWNEINYSSWRCADPALQFHDIINDWNTCPLGENGENEEIRGSNPCSEYHFLDDTACNLASINIVKFYDSKNNKFDINGYLHTISLVQLVLESTIHWGQFPTEDIAKRSHFFRTTGLGIANTGSLHIMMGHPYDSDNARTIAAALVGVMTGQSYYVSSLMAKEIGSFSKYEINKNHMLKVIKNHAIAAGSIHSSYEGLGYTPAKVNHEILIHEKQDDLSETLKNIWKKAVEGGEKYGYRNAQVSVIAPTGTISLAMDCATTSIEPFFAHVVYKKLVGGGFMEFINPYIPTILQKLGYSKEQIEDIVNYVMKKETINENGYEYEKIIDGKIEGAPHIKEEHLPIFDTANKCGSGKRFISPMGHVKMVAALTPFVSGAISKTVNLPNEATIDDFKNVYSNAFELGVKCISLYRDGSKASQPLNQAKSTKDKKLEDMTYNELLEYVKALKEDNKQNLIKIDEKKNSKEYKKVTCSNCSSTSIIPNGTCHICRNCGTTTGCS